MHYKNKEEIYKVSKDLLNNYDLKNLKISDIKSIYKWSNNRFYSSFINKNDILKEAINDIEYNIKIKSFKRFKYDNLIISILEIYEYFNNGDKEIIMINLNNYHKFFIKEFKRIILKNLSKLDFYKNIDDIDTYLNFLISRIMFAIKFNDKESIFLFFIK